MGKIFNRSLLSKLGALALVAVLALPSVAFAGQGKGRGKGQAKKSEKFKNGHDARDGRWDGRGPKHRNGRWNDRRDRRDRDYDRNRDYDRDRDHRDHDRDRDYRYDERELQRIATDQGYREGFQAGVDDARSNDRFSYEDHRAYHDATRGYRNEYGSIDTYRHYFREGFRRGYEEGYRRYDDRY